MVAIPLPPLTEFLPSTSDEVTFGFSITPGAVDGERNEYDDDTIVELDSDSDQGATIASLDDNIDDERNCVGANSHNDPEVMEGIIEQEEDGIQSPHHMNCDSDILKLELDTSSYGSCVQRKLTHKGCAPTSVYKDVVVVGNGPSGIVLSYFLAGNWPYYNGGGDGVNEMLHYRLLAAASTQPHNASIVEQDLHFLAQGLEGRSSNPVALLFDTLNHPNADLGLELPSLLEWRRSSKQSVDHVVIGKGPPGGAWQLMDGNVLTISLGCWMELPQMNFREWQQQQEARCIRESRASVASVAQYYCDYVRAHQLEDYFVSHSEITEVTRIPYSGLPSVCDNLPEDVLEQLAEAEDSQDRRVRRHTISEIPVKSQNGRDLPRARTLWQVKGFTHEGRGRRKEFSYLTKSLVLATGSSDSPNILNVPGEQLDFVLHSLKHLEQLISSGELNQDSDPIMVVGAGLSAADAIIAARFHSIPVIHAYRRSVEDKNLIFKQLPENMYPEYHKVYQMMQDPTSYDGYKVFEQHVVAEIRPDKRVKLMGSLSCGVAKVSYILICIGSHPNLSFLNGLERNIGVHPGLPIDAKRNPVAINFSTHESVREPGLFSLGPLVGENFVRFLQGGALAITNHLNQLKKIKS